jgi:signal recognition particle subunit SRP54
MKGGGLMKMMKRMGGMKGLKGMMPPGFPGA